MSGNKAWQMALTPCSSRAKTDDAGEPKEEEMAVVSENDEIAG